MKNFRLLVVLLLSCSPLLAQTTPGREATGASSATQTETQPAAKQAQPDRAAAYYHYSMARIYEELVALYGRSEFASKAIDELRQAIENDPDSGFLNAGLAELYAKTGRIRDAVLEAQEILKRNPKNLEARKLLGRIYLRSLGDAQSGTQSQQLLKLAIEQFEQIVLQEPDQSDNFLLLGRLYSVGKDYPKAEEAFLSAVRLQPNSEEAVINLAFLYNEQGAAAKAAETLSKMPEASRSGKLYAALGYTYEQQRDYKKAIAAYGKAVELDRENLDATRGLAQNLLNDGQLEPALEQYNAIAEADPQDAQALLRISEIQRRTGKFEAALESLKKADSLVADSLEVPFNLSIVYAALGRYDDSVQMLRGLLEKSAKPDGQYSKGEAGNRAVFLERLGLLYRENGKTQLALDTFSQMLTLGDENAARGHQQIIDTYRDAKQWKEAIAAAETAIAAFPNDRNLTLMYAGQLADSGKAEAGIARVKSLLKGGSDDREVYIGLSQIYSRLKRWKEAEEAAAEAYKLSGKPDEKEYAAFIQGSIYERQKKYDAAEERFRQVLANDPRNAMAMNYLGYMLAERGVRLDEGLTLIKKAVEMDPQNGAYLDSLGWAYFKLGNYDLAEEYLRKAVSRVGNDATLHDHLGDLYQKTGRLKLAAAHWARALEEWNKSVPADVDTADFAKAQKKLESARVRLAQQGEGK